MINELNKGKNWSELNMEKAKIMPNKTALAKNMKTDGKELTAVKELKYLGKIITNISRWRYYARNN